MNTTKKLDLNRLKSFMEFGNKYEEFVLVEEYVDDDFEYSTMDFEAMVRPIFGLPVWNTDDRRMELLDEQKNLIGYLSLSLTRMGFFWYELSTISFRFKHATGIFKDDSGYGLQIQMEGNFTKKLISDCKSIFEAEYLVDCMTDLNTATFVLRIKKDKYVKAMFNKNVPNFFFKDISEPNVDESFSNKFVNLTESLNKSKKYDVLTLDF